MNDRLVCKHFRFEWKMTVDKKPKNIVIGKWNLWFYYY